MALPSLLWYFEHSHACMPNARLDAATTSSHLKISTGHRYDESIRICADQVQTNLQIVLRLQNATAEPSRYNWPRAPTATRSHSPRSGTEQFEPEPPLHPLAHALLVRKEDMGLSGSARSWRHQASTDKIRHPSTTLSPSNETSTQTQALQTHLPIHLPTHLQIHHPRAVNPIREGLLERCLRGVEATVLEL